METLGILAHVPEQRPVSWEALGAYLMHQYRIGELLHRIYPMFNSQYNNVSTTSYDTTTQARSSDPSEAPYEWQRLGAWMRGSMVIGGLYYGLQGARLGGLQFFAEAQHVPPRTKSDWFRYHQQKNYRIMASFTGHALRYGWRIPLIQGTLCAGLEAALAIQRQRRDGWNIFGAFVGTAAIASPLSDPRHACWAFRYGVRMILPFAAVAGILEQTRISLCLASLDGDRTNGRAAEESFSTSVLADIIRGLTYPFKYAYGAADGYFRDLGHQTIKQRNKLVPIAPEIADQDAVFIPDQSLQDTSSSFIVAHETKQL